MSSEPAQHADHEPYCLAMVLCDNVHRDPATGKFTLLGTFHGIRAKQLPITLRLCVFFALTDVLGRYDFRVQVVPASAHLVDQVEPVVSNTMQLESPDPLAIIEGVVQLQAAFPEAGVYHIELYAGDSPLLSRRITIIN